MLHALLLDKLHTLLRIFFFKDVVTGPCQPMVAPHVFHFKDWIEPCLHLYKSLFTFVLQQHQVVLVIHKTSPSVLQATLLILGVYYVVLFVRFGWNFELFAQVVLVVFRFWLFEADILDLLEHETESILGGHQIHLFFVDAV